MPILLGVERFSRLLLFPLGFGILSSLLQKTVAGIGLLKTKRREAFNHDGFFFAQHIGNSSMEGRVRGP